jgi:hypothetical protein
MFTLVLDIDDTLLKEVAYTHRNHPLVTSIVYQPSPASYQRYAERARAVVTEKDGLPKNRSTVLHYELHDDGATITSCVLVRPAMTELLGALCGELSLFLVLVKLINMRGVALSSINTFPQMNPQKLSCIPFEHY